MATASSRWVDAQDVKAHAGVGDVGATDHLLPIAIEVKFEADCPNGPYVEWTGEAAGILCCPEKTQYDAVANTILDAWIRKLTYDASTASRLKMMEIEFKGGPVQRGEEAREGNHNVKMVIKHMALSCACNVM